MQINEYRDGFDYTTQYGRVIRGVERDDKQIRLLLDSGDTLVIRDAGQSCCEQRYLVCDDDIHDLVGLPLTKLEVRDVTSTEAEYGDRHEIAFMEIQAGHVYCTFSTHNEHNGYYGGFDLTVSLEKPEQE